MKSGKNKGTQFEREICKQLSLWWSNGKDDAIFWRTSGSGARAKVRSKAGKTTFGQYGDIQAINPIGQPLIELFNIEIKRGYSSDTIFNLVDKTKTSKKQMYEKFINQAVQDKKNSNRPFWLLISKRNGKETMIYFSHKLMCFLLPLYLCRPRLYICYILSSSKTLVREISAVPLSQFLLKITPKQIMELKENKDVH